MAIAWQVVRLCDEAAREARKLERNYENAYLASPRGYWRDLFKSNFDDELKEILRLRRESRANILYHEMITHTWPWERNDYWDPTLNIFCARLIRANFRAKDVDRFNKSVVSWHIFFTDFWDNLIEAARKLDAAKK